METQTKQALVKGLRVIADDMKVEDVDERTNTTAVSLEVLMRLKALALLAADELEQN